MPTAAAAAAQPAGRERCRVQSWGRGKNEQLGKPSVQNSGYTSLHPDFWTVVILEVLQKCCFSFCFVLFCFVFFNETFCYPLHVVFVLSWKLTCKQKL